MATVTEAQIRAKRENDQEHKRTPSGFLFKQRAFLKMYLITLTENKRLYGHEMLDLLRNEFRSLGYRPTRSEIYKSLHDLIDTGILEEVVEIKEGLKRQKVIYYRIINKQKAKKYKELVREDIDRSIKILNKAIKDNF